MSRLVKTAVLAASTILAAPARFDGGNGIDFSKLDVTTLDLTTDEGKAKLQAIVDGEKTALQEKNSQLIGEKRTVQDKLTAAEGTIAKFGDTKPEDVDALRTENTQLKKTAKTPDDVTAAVDAAKEPLTTRIAELEGENGTLKSELGTTIVNHASASALAEAEALPAHSRFLSFEISQRTRVTEVDGKRTIEVLKPDGTVMHTAEGPATVKDLVDSLKKSDEFASSFKGNQKKAPGDAGGRAPDGGKNPFAKDTFNLTAQIEMKNSDPARAAQLEAAASS